MFLGTGLFYCGSSEGKQSHWCMQRVAERDLATERARVADLERQLSEARRERDAAVAAERERCAAKVERHIAALEAEADNGFSPGNGRQLANFSAKVSLITLLDQIRSGT